MRTWLSHTHTHIQTYTICTVQMHHAKPLCSAPPTARSLQALQGSPQCRTMVCAPAWQHKSKPACNGVHYIYVIHSIMLFIVVYMYTHVRSDYVPGGLHCKAIGWHPCMHMQASKGFQGMLCAARQSARPKVPNPGVQGHWQHCAGSAGGPQRPFCSGRCVCPCDSIAGKAQGMLEFWHFDRNMDPPEDLWILRRSALSKWASAAAESSGGGTSVQRQGRSMNGKPLFLLSTRHTGVRPTSSGRPARGCQLREGPSIGAGLLCRH